MRFPSTYLVLAMSNLAAALTQFGLSSNTKANVESTFSYLDGTSLSITTSADAAVTFSLYLDASVSSGVKSALPSGANTVAFLASANAGFTLSVSPSSATIVSATLSTPSFSNTAKASLTSETDLGVLLVNTTANTFQRVDVTSYNVETGKTVVSLPSAGTYIFVSFKSAAYVPATFGRKLKHEGSAAANKTYRYSKDFAMQFNSSATTTLDVLRYAAVNATLGTKARGFASFKFDQSNKAEFNASLVYEYNKSEVEGAGYKVENLAWWTFDETTKVWVQVPSVVDVKTSTVVASTVHFSEWTIAASMSGAFGTFGVPTSLVLVAVTFAVIAGLL